MTQHTSPHRGHDTTATWEYCEAFHRVDEVLARAQFRAEEIGTRCVSPAVGTFLQMQAGAVGARAVVEIGTGTGVSGLWLMRGFQPHTVLTTIEADTTSQRLARETFAEAKIPGNRIRLISGTAMDVLPRLSDSAYDLVFVDADVEDIPDYAVHAHRLLRAGGVMIVHGIGLQGRTGDPECRDAHTSMMRDFCDNLADNPAWHSSLIATGDGLAVAVSQGT